MARANRKVSGRVWTGRRIVMCFTSTLFQRNREINVRIRIKIIAKRSFVNPFILLYDEKNVVKQ
jgi:hypothetical protein